MNHRLENRNENVGKVISMLHFSNLRFLTTSEDVKLMFKKLRGKYTINSIVTLTPRVLSPFNDIQGQDSHYSFLVVSQLFVLSS